MGMDYVKLFKDRADGNCGGCSSCKSCKSCHSCKSNRVQHEDETGPDEFYFQWHLTDRCDLRCKHCYHEAYSGDADLGEGTLLRIAEDITASLRAWGRRGTIALTGGEPTLRLQELEVVAAALADGDQVERVDVLTNGQWSIGRPETVEVLAGLPLLSRVQLSLDGADDATHDGTRGAGSFRAVERAVQLLQGCGVEVAVMMTLSQRNVHQVAGLHDLAHGWGVTRIGLDRYAPQGQSAADADQALGREEVRQAYMVAAEWRKSRDLPPWGLYRPLFCLTGEDAGGLCSAGLTGLTIMHDGIVYPCRRLPIEIGCLPDDTLAEIWKRPGLMDQLRDPEAVDGCRDCKHLARCRGCRGVAYATTGDPLARDPHCWLKHGERGGLR